MPKRFFKVLVDVEDYGADGVILHYIPQSGGEVHLVQVREGPAVSGPMLIVGAEILYQKRTGQFAEPPFTPGFSRNQVPRSEFINRHTKAGSKRPDVLLTQSRPDSLAAVGALPAVDRR